MTARERRAELGARILRVTLEEIRDELGRLGGEAQTALARLALRALEDEATRALEEVGAIGLTEGETA